MAKHVYFCLPKATCTPLFIRWKCTLFFFIILLHFLVDILFLFFFVSFLMCIWQRSVGWIRNEIALISPHCQRRDYNSSTNVLFSLLPLRCICVVSNLSIKVIYWKVKTLCPLFIYFYFFFTHFICFSFFFSLLYVYLFFLHITSYWHASKDPSTK